MHHKTCKSLIVFKGAKNIARANESSIYLKMIFVTNKESRYQFQPHYHSGYCEISITNIGIKNLYETKGWRISLPIIAI